MKKTTLKTTIIILIFAFALSGCSLFPKKPPTTVAPPTTKPPTTKPAQTIEEQLAGQSQIYKFTDLDELKEFLEQGPATPSYGYGFGRGMMMEEMAMPSAAPGLDIGAEFISNEIALGSKSVSGLGGAQDYSTTNVQVEGVDEADIIKTDGKYIYAVSQKNLFIVEAYPADQAKVLAKIAFESRPQDIYINGNSLIVFGYDDVFYRTEVYKIIPRRTNFTFFKVFDISDRTNPKQVRDLDFEGNYSNSRMIGDYVYFVTQNYNYYWDDEMPIPLIVENGETVANSCAGGAGCLIPDIYYFNFPYQSYNFVSVNAISVKDHKKAITGDIYLLSGNQNMYVSQSNIYITYTKYISEYQLMMEVMKEVVYPKLLVKDQEKIAKIEAVDNFILSPEEKMQKISYILERYASSLTDEENEKLEEEVQKAMKQKYQDISKELEKTVIHKIAISNDKLEYKTFGEVTGQVLNQFSMDENNGYFRIATTKNRTWSQFEDNNQESYNNLYVLDENLKQVGAVERLAEGEQIYSVRFMQNRAYMVTFRQMDPLFVIDLSNPAKPKVLGKLKIPGYSDYLHPYDDTTLIGFGKDADESGRAKGLKLSLFDVSNVSDPKEIDTYIIGDAGSDSIALHDHKAFLFSREKSLLVIPVSIQESGVSIIELEPLTEFREEVLSSRYPRLSFSGAAVFKVDKTGFELKGKIDHSDGGKVSQQDYWRGYNYYDNTVKRSLYIDDVLYTFSNQYLKMNKIEDLELVKNLELKKEKSGSGDDFEVIN